MRKMYLFALMLMIIGSSVNAQKIKLLKGQLSKKPATQIITTGNNSINHAKQLLGVDAVLSQNFDSPTFPPSGWSVSGSPTGWYNSADAAINQYEANGTPSGHFAYYDCFNETNLSVSSLITPVLHPTASSNTLTYKVNYYLLNTGFIAAGAKLYIEFSIDGGTTWTTSTNNVLAPLTGYNTASTGWISQTVSLAAYNTQAVNVRFRAVSDYGGFGLGIDDVTGPEADVVTATNDISITKTSVNFSGLSYYGITPISQMGPVEFKCYVSNTGSAAQTSVTLHANANNGLYNVASGVYNPIASFAGAGADSLDATITPTETGATDYAVALNVTQTQTDENIADNSDSIYFSTDTVTYLRCAAANVYASPYLGSSVSAVAGTVFGATYHFLSAGVINDVFTYIYKNKGNTSIKAVLYEVNLATGVPTQVDSSASVNLTTTTTATPYQLPLVSQYNVNSGSLYIAGIKMTFAAGDTIYPLAQTAASFSGPSATASWNFINVPANGGWGWYNLSFIPYVGLFMDAPTSVNTVASNYAASVYPNPTTGKLNIVNAKNSIVTVFNMLGQEVVKMNSTSATGTIDISNMAEGTYFVKIQSEGNVTTKKINLVK